MKKKSPVSTDCSSKPIPKKKRPFNRLKGVNKECDAYAIEHNRRPFVFGFTTEDGATIYSDGSVPVANVQQVLKLFLKMRKLSQS
jgi:hypothetical protein